MPEDSHIISAYNVSVTRSSVKAIIVVTRTGETVHKLLAYKPAVPVVAVVNEHSLAAQMGLLDGVHPLLFDGDLHTPDWRMKKDDKVIAAISHLKQKNLAAHGDDVVVLTGARPDSTSGAAITCTLKV